MLFDIKRSVVADHRQSLGSDREKFSKYFRQLRQIRSYLALETQNRSIVGYTFQPDNPGPDKKENDRRSMTDNEYLL